jgi:hypothetical protein
MRLESGSSPFPRVREDRRYFRSVPDAGRHAGKSDAEKVY